MGNNELAGKINPIKKKSVPEEIISQIRRLIDTGAISAGSKLPSEREFARMLNVSRPSLREALRVLSLLGVLENRPGSGTYLTSAAHQGTIEPFSILLSLKKGTLMDILEARQGLEGTVARLAAERRTPGEIERMAGMIEKMRESIRLPEEYSRYELEFHKMIIDAARNNIIADLMVKIYRMLVDVRNFIRHYEDDPVSFLQKDLASHEKIFRFIRQGDGKEASRAMIDHHQIFMRSIEDDADSIVFNKSQKGGGRAALRSTER